MFLLVSFCLTVSFFKYIYMTIIILILNPKKNRLQIIPKNKQQSHDLRMPFESYEKLIWLHIYVCSDIGSIYQKTEINC